MNKTISGKIIATKMQQTATVLVERKKKHPKYLKQYKVSKKYLVHNPKDAFKVGDNVIITETKPISKRKSFIITSKVKD